MRRKRWLLPALALILTAGLVVYLWSPWKTRQESFDIRNVSELVTATRQKTEAVKNYKYKTNISVGEQIKVSVLNRILLGNPKSQLVDFTWSIPQSSGIASMYTAGSRIFIFNPVKDRWVLPEEEPTGKPFMDFFWRQLKLIDPVENLLSLDPGKGNITIYNDGGDEGKDTISIEVTPTASDLAEMTKVLPPQLAGAELADIKQHFWISKKDLLVTRYEVKARVAFFGLKTMEFKTVTETLDYNNTKIELSKALLDKMKQGQ